MILHGVASRDTFQAERFNVVGGRTFAPFHGLVAWCYPLRFQQGIIARGGARQKVGQGVVFSLWRRRRIGALREEGACKDVNKSKGHGGRAADCAAISTLRFVCVCFHTMKCKDHGDRAADRKAISTLRFAFVWFHNMKCNKTKQIVTSGPRYK